MLIDPHELQGRILHALAECSAFEPPPNRAEITRYVLELLRDDMTAEIHRCLEQMSTHGDVVKEMTAWLRGEDVGYELPPNCVV